MIQTAKPDVLMLDLAEECPEAPVGALRRALQKAVKKFSATGLVKVWIAVPTQVGVDKYPLEGLVCAGFRIKHIRNVEWCGQCIDCVEECKGCQSGYRVDDLHHISLVGSYVPKSNSLANLRVQVVLRPTNENCDIPQDMLDEFEDELFNGALYYLLRQSKKEWGDRRAAQDYKDLFEGGIVSAKCLAETKHNDCNTTMGAACII